MKIIGIDLNWSRIAFAVFNPKQEKFIDEGVFTLSSIRKSYFQKKQCFVQNEKWKRQQEQDVGKFTNFLCFLMKKYDAMPVFEHHMVERSPFCDFISPFVYVGEATPAKKQKIKDVWGSAEWKGHIVSGYRTSLVCRECGIDALYLLEKLKKQEEPNEKQKQFYAEISKDVNENKEKNIYFCQECATAQDVDSMAAKNIALKFHFQENFTKEQKAFLKNKEVSEFDFFLKKSQEFSQEYQILNERYFLSK